MIRWISGVKMPRRKDDPPDLVTIKVSIPKALKEDCTKARLAGLRKNDAESTFMRYLVELGLRKYEKAILPIERADYVQPPLRAGDRVVVEFPDADKTVREFPVDSPMLDILGMRILEIKHPQVTDELDENAIEPDEKEEQSG
jgi:hypothetical protein